jgi:hypothetical protein
VPLQILHILSPVMQRVVFEAFPGDFLSLVQILPPTLHPHAVATRFRGPGNLNLSGIGAVRGCPFTSKRLAGLLMTSSCCSALRILDASNIGLGPEGMRAFAPALSAHKQTLQVRLLGHYSHARTLLACQHKPQWHSLS